MFGKKNRKTAIKIYSTKSTKVKVTIKPNIKWRRGEGVCWTFKKTLDLLAYLVHISLLNFVKKFPTFLALNPNLPSKRPKPNAADEPRTLTQFAHFTTYISWRAVFSDLRVSAPHHSLVGRHRD